MNDLVSERVRKCLTLISIKKPLNITKLLVVVLYSRQNNIEQFLEVLRNGGNLMW